MTTLHPDLQRDELGHLFNVAGDDVDALRAHIGQKVLYLSPTCIVECGVFTIGSVQRTYSGHAAFRVYADATTEHAADTFGRVALPNDVRVIA